LIVDVGSTTPSTEETVSARPRMSSTPGPASLTGLDAVVITEPIDTNDRWRPGVSALGQACAVVADAAIPGQTIILASASYVGCTHDLLLRPLERRGFVIHRDVHVGFCSALDGECVSSTLEPPLVGTATPGCAAVAAAAGERVGAIQLADTLEEAEARALAGPRRSGWADRAKRGLDVVVASLVLTLLAPIFALIATAVFLDDGRPILFTQERVGINGLRFQFRKFRTMTDGAEAHLNDVLDMNGIHGPAFQIANDPRLTPIGGFLRKSSLDELPQFWNVLRGEMSLVGPRPAPVVEVAAYKPWHRRRLTVKPGITGLAQVTARSYRDFDERATLDLDYIDRWSVWLDITILLRTALAALRMTGR
jgi:lipopolysaccharide/colanic/teichoic acid biosynthesis glycosyltransferase